MNDQGGEGIGLLVTGIFKFIIYLTFLGFYAVRINKLDKLASNSLQKDRSLKFRIACVLLLITLTMLHIVLSFTDPFYYMYPYRDYSLIELVGIADFVLQIYIITREYKKKTRRSRSVVAMWVLLAIEETCSIGIVEYYNANVGVLLPITKVIITVILIILTCSIEPTPETTLQSLNQTISGSKLLPLISDTTSRYGRENDRIYVEFNKQFQIALQKDHYECSFKIAVYIEDKFHIINKSQGQFISLSREMIQIFPNSDIVSLKNMAKNINAVNITKFGEERQKIYENFLVDLTKTDQYYAEPLMNFLEIKQQQRASILKYKGALLKKCTLNSQDEQKLKRAFFTVSWKQGKIHVSNPQILDFFVNKSAQQITAFHNRLVSQKTLKIQLISEQSDESELAHFIYRVVNSKVLWRSFAEWMSLGQAIQDKIYNMFGFWNLGFQNLDMSIIGYETSFDKDNSMIYFYMLSITKKDSTVKQGIMLKKRYNDFVKLDKNIKKFIISQGIKSAHMPSLPPRISPFQNKTSPNFRRVYFDAYIKDIIKIEGMNHCIKLLQFLQVDNQEKAEQFYKNEGQQNELPRVNSMCLQDLDFDK